MARIKKIEGFWKIPDVHCKHKTMDVDLANEPLPKMKEDELIKYSINARANNEFHAASLPFYYAVFATLFNHKEEDEAREARDFLHEQFDEECPVTLTRIRYVPEGKDEIIHNYKMSDEYRIKANVVNPHRDHMPDDYMKSPHKKALLKALFWMDNAIEINNIFRWITGKSMQFTRSEFRPDSVNECGVRFVNDRLSGGVYCAVHPDTINSAIGIRESTDNSKTYSLNDIKKVLKKEGITSKLEKDILSNL